MIKSSTKCCALCNGALKHVDDVFRIQRTRAGKTFHIGIPRFRCEQCGKSKRDIPDTLYPYKHYEAEIIRGVVEGLITSDTLGFEDYPCEKTMQIWKRQYGKDI